MFKLIGDGTFSLWLSALGGILVIAVVYWTVPYSKGYQAADQRHQAEYDQNAADYEARRKCERLATVKSAVACYDHASKTSRESHRAEQDLDAQREMAQWAESMLYATLATFAAAIAGVVFLWRDTRQNMKVGQAQTRAYFKEPTYKFRWWDKVEEGGGFAVWCRWENAGQTPAYSANFHAYHALIDVPPDIKIEEIENDILNRSLGNGVFAVGAGMNLKVCEITQEDQDRLYRHETQLVLFTMICFKDAFGRIQHHSNCSVVMLTYEHEPEKISFRTYARYNDQSI